MKIEVQVQELRKKKIFIATPMYGGNCVGMFSKACIDLATMCANYGVETRFFFIFNESLITRARNYLVDEFLRAEGFTHLMFIDSDIHFDPRDVLSLAVLCDDDKPIIGGPYGKKCIAWEKIRRAVDIGIADEEPDELAKFTGDFVFNPVLGTKEMKVNEPVEVLEIGTGFMMVKRDVFDDWREAFPQFTYRPDHNRSEHFAGDRMIHAYFDTVIDSKAYLGDISDNSERYLSEDYFFCQFVRKLGYQIFLCPWMKLGHMGTYVFSGSMGSLANLEFAAHGADTARVSNHEKRRKNRNKKKRK